MSPSQSQYDITIIGAGFAGLATAYFLSQNSKASILVLDKESSFGVHASGKNAALFRQAVSNIEIAKLIQVTRRFLQDPPQDWKHHQLFRQTGSLLLGSSEAIQGLQNLLHSLETPAEYYPKRQYPSHLPNWLQQALKQHHYEALLHSPYDGVVDVHALMENLYLAAKTRGIEFCFQTEAEALQHNGKHWVLEYSQAGLQKPNLQKSGLQSQMLVNAAGAWAQNLAADAKIQTETLTPMRRHLFISEPVTFSNPTCPWLWDIQHQYYFRPESGGLLLCPGDEESHPATEPQTDPKALELLAQKLSRYFPSLAYLSIQRSWACLRTKSPNGAFKLGFDAAAPNFYWVAALGGHGMSSSLGVGQKAAREIMKKL